MIILNTEMKKMYGQWMVKIIILQEEISQKNGEIKSLQSMSLYSNNLGMCIATEFIDDKSNKIPTGPKLLNLFNLENTIVTFDALNTQEDTIKTIVKQNGFYVAAIKGNQGKTYENLVDYFNDEQLLKQVKEENYCCNIEKVIVHI